MSLSNLNQHIDLCAKRLELQDQALLATAAGDYDEADRCDQEIEEITCQLEVLKHQESKPVRIPKTLASIFDYPGYAEAWDRFAKASNRLSRKLRKAGIPVDLQEEVEKATFELTCLEVNFNNDLYVFRKYRYPAPSPERINLMVEFLKDKEQEVL